jgi:uncharacterized membrane protein
MTDAATRPRLPGIDVLRGIAVAAMIVYHFAWDLRFFGLIATDIVNHPGWMAFARAIAGTFLLLSGVSLALMARRAFDRTAFLRRLGLIGGAAALVTLATWIAMPNAFIFFGILHCIAVSSVLALPFLRLPPAATALAAAAIFALPYFFWHPVFDTPLLQWLGLGTRLPQTNDYVPLFPWFGVALAGVALGRVIGAAPPGVLAAEPAPALKPVAKAGRWSLPIYLIHQPVLLAILYLAALGLTPSGSADTTTLEFRRACRETCRQTGGEAGLCERYCACAEEDIRKAELWTPLLRNALDARQQSRISTITEACEARAR